MEQLFEKRLSEMIVKHVSVLDGYIETLLPKDRSYTFNKTNSRKVLGSMTDLKFLMPAVYNSYGSLTSNCYEHMNRSMVSIIMGGIKYQKSKNKIKEEIEARL